MDYTYKNYLYEYIQNWIQLYGDNGITFFVSWTVFELQDKYSEFLPFFSKKRDVSKENIFVNILTLRMLLTSLWSNKELILQ